MIDAYIIRYLINGLSTAKDEINRPLNGATVEVMAALIVPQGILQPYEPNPVKGTLIPCYHRGNGRRHRPITIRTVIRILSMIKEEMKKFLIKLKYPTNQNRVNVINVLIN